MPAPVEPMNISRYFIDRPIFAAVLSFAIFISGLIAILQLPISEYPEAVPPQVVVTAQFPGANPKIIAETVATPLEEQMNGIDNLLYTDSQATSDGSMKLTATFKIGTRPEEAETAVQNRINRALPRLPEVTRQIGVTTERSSPNLAMVVHLVSPDGRYDALYLRNYAVLHVRDQLLRLRGVGQTWLAGSGDYAMRIWLNPAQLSARGLSTSDVVDAIREQNLQVAAGVIGAPPGPDAPDFQLAVSAQGRLTTEDEFSEITVRSAPDGSTIRVRDVGRVELGQSTYAVRSLLHNEDAFGVAIFQAPDSNALQMSKDVRAEMEVLAKDFPPGLEYRIIYDTTAFVSASIESVIHTLFEAVALVVLVVILFLQSWRAAIIPLLTVPVAAVGTFGVLLLLGYSINTLTLFALVLSIGIVVDDAIVVVENVERHMELGKSAHDAAVLAMQEVSGPIIAIALVLCAVFVPLAFVSGLSGQFFRQFAVTIAISTVISAFNSLTLSPTLAARLLVDHAAPQDRLQRFID
ncbi:MAG TPA: efflux RND transporter permease subunit, partial [Thermomicrobiales bacterium]|nr:efflux RND transporter permease subunit [Thermomicrobiales bacterium]